MGFRRTGLLFLLMLVLVLPATAQDMPTTFDFNYCAGVLDYDLPDGWVVMPPVASNYGVSQTFASSNRVLKSGTMSVDGDHLIVIITTARDSLLPSLGLDADAKLTDILSGAIGQLIDVPEIDSVTAIEVGGQPAAIFEFYSEGSGLLMLALSLDADVIGLIMLGAQSDDAEEIRATLLNFAESITFHAPRFATEYSDEYNVSLTTTYASEDCAVSFSYPDSLILTDAGGYDTFYASLTTTDSPTEDPFDLETGQASLEMYVIPRIDTTDEKDSIENIDEYIDSPSTVITHDTGNIGAYAADIVTVEDDTGDIVYLQIKYNPNITTTILLRTPHGELADWTPTLYAIAQSLNVNAAVFTN